MRAAVFDRYGPPEVMRIAEVPTPEPKAGEVLVRVRATAVNAIDWRFRKADPFFIRLMGGLTRPKAASIGGVDFAGTVAALGDGVTRFAVGDPVFGITRGFACHAEYVCVPQDGSMAATPANMSCERAAAIPFGAISALHFLEAADIRPGQRVLVYGASGAVGVYAVQLARQMGARVTGVCSTANLDLVRSLGAETVVDYTRQDFAAEGPVYDVVFDTVGKARIGRLGRALKPGGVLLNAASMTLMLLGPLARPLTGAGKVVAGMAHGSPERMARLKALIECGDLRPVIDTSFPLAAIAEAHRLAEGGHKRGAAVVLIDDAEAPTSSGGSAR